MQPKDADISRDAPRHAWPRRIIRRFCRSEDGATAIEFAMLALPYFLIVFAIIETFIAFTAEQLVSNAVDEMARRLRTGQITLNMNRTTDKNRIQFRAAFCDEIAILIRCSETEKVTASKLYIDIRSFSSFANIPKTIPRVSTATFADLDTSGFQYNPGGPSSINMVRAYYRWQIMTDIVRPFITTIRSSGGGMPTDFLIVATSAFQNEAYP